MGNGSSDPSAEGGARPRRGDLSEPIGHRLARETAPRQLDDDDKRRKWGLPPKGSDEHGHYIVELNARHAEGMPAAEDEFMKLLGGVVGGKAAAGRRVRRIAKNYVCCRFADAEWRRLVERDEARPVTQRAVYRLWPDFRVEHQTTRSISTIKADAALRSFDAAGEGVVWAVIDSGVDASHPHFGPPGDEHTLLAPAVAGLHRSFAYREDGSEDPPVGPLDSPDEHSRISAAKRRRLLDAHQRDALRDPYGHGTHVAGIIAGGAPSDGGTSVRVLEQEYRVGNSEQSIVRRFAEARACAQRPRGVAPRCKVISLRVLDAAGQGRASQVIQALEYIREKVNDNPKMMRVHGVNLSVGYEFDAEMFACGQSPLCIAVDRLVQEGVVVVCAAGNTGYATVAASVGTTRVGLSNSINDPGNAELAMTVGATHAESPYTYGVSYFSSKGPTGDGRQKPDLIAPGERIVSCAAGAKRDEALASCGLAADPACADYRDDSGTSMAAPHVSGAIAAFLSIRREFIGRPREVKRVFLESATSLGRERYFEGNGLLDLMRAIQSV